MNIHTHGRRIVHRSHVNVDISSFDIIEPFDHLYCGNFEHIETMLCFWNNSVLCFVTMETPNNSNNNNTVDLTTMEEVSIFNEDGSKETFHFAVSPRVVVIEDSSEAEVKAEEEEEEELTKEKKRRRDFHVDEPTPQRTTRSDIKQSELASLQPVPSVTEEPLQSFSIEELEERLRDELPDLTEADIEIMTM